MSYSAETEVRCGTVQCDQARIATLSSAIVPTRLVMKRHQRPVSSVGRRLRQTSAGGAA